MVRILNMTKTLIPIFADQLSHGLSSLAISSPEESVVLMMEVAEEAGTVAHHRKKLIFLFSAMRHFAKELKEHGWTVEYIKLDDEDNSGSFTSEIKRAIKHYDISQLRVCEPSEYRVLEIIKGWKDVLNLPVTMPAKDDLFMPKPLRFQPDPITQEVIEMVKAEFPTRFGNADNFFFAVTRHGAKEALECFIKNVLPRFGDYQDAMLTGEPFLYHSLLSMYLNVGLLGPIEICEAVEAAYRDGKAPLNAAEGYIRQIIGWREYVRGIYWLKMPDYLEENALTATRDLPEFYWTGDTDMHCLSEAIGQTKEHAYAHHIQRLMITGNFALLIGVDPKQVHEWYLAVYIDAFEWVELPNTLGMSQFGDGGLLGSKPYASSGAYINRMSNYCKSCKYSVKTRVGENACPFNSLYWHFIARNEDALSGNNRMSMPYRNLAKMDEDVRDGLIAQADTFLKSLEPTKGDYY